MKEQQEGIMGQFKYMTLTQAEGRAIEARWFDGLLKEYNVDVAAINAQ